MPFKSEKQRGYLLAHPEITDKKGKSVGRKWVKEYGGKVSKGKHDWTKAVVAGTAAGALANQFPRVQDIATEKKRRKRERAKIKKVMAPTSTDPYFNQAAAQKAFDLVMKMDRDTAEMFTYIVASDLFEQTVEQNLSTIQKALNRVFDERMEQVKKALTRAALNAPADQIEEFGKAYEKLEEISKAPRTPQFYGYDWKESDFKRDPGTGRFMVKVKHTMGKPLKEKQADAIVGSYGPKELNDDQRARYQDEYRQVASFLSGVNQFGAGNMDVVYHLKDNAGNQFSTLLNTGKPPKDVLEDPDVTLVAMEAKPTTLTAGGAAFGLAGGLTGDQVRRTNLVFSDQETEGIRQLSGQWANAGTEGVSTSRMFNRLEATGSFMNAAAPPGSQAQLAGKFAEIVGQFGPQAEQVLGPSARKTAYRYRGTEKAPERPLVRAYAREISDAKRYGITEDEADQQILGFGTRREPKRGDFVGAGARRPTGARERGREIVTPSINQMARARGGEAQEMLREPTWAERGAGSAMVTEYLRQKLPDKHLYRLHIEAGNTPPSEGVIINSEGSLAVQAVGYGDDHYLPFNLKNLKALKGGEYIRNRSVGGLTSEDVYTGLMAGARRVTVVSRSGTFTMEFEEDFRGGRRHNDKARRMTRRYENLLDAVQSGQVDRATIPPRWRKAIENEVKEDPDYAGAPKSMVRDEINARITEFKEKPEIDGRDLDRAEAMIDQMESRAAMGEVSEQTAGDFRRQVMNELHNMKEVKFRLNGIGYEAALNSLQEQFPYYIKDVKTNPTRDEELLEFALDEGYVEPGRNRPSRARANLFGTKENPGGAFQSASQVDYQRGRAGAGVFKPASAAAVAAAAVPGAPPTDPEARRKEALRIKDAFAEQEKVMSAKKATRKLREVAIAGQPSFEGKDAPLFWTMSEERFDEWVARPENADAFHREMEANAQQWSAPGGLPGFGAAWVQYQAARGATRQVKYQPQNAGHFPVVPYSFADDPKDAYHAGARPGVIDVELRRIDREEPMFTTKKLASQLTNDEMESEIERTQFLRAQAQGAGIADVLAEHVRTTPGAPSPERMKVALSSDTRVNQHLENIHRARYLNEMKKVAKTPPAAKPRDEGPRPGGSGGLPTPSQPRPTTEPGTQATTTETTVNARIERLKGARDAVLKLDKDQNDPGLNQAQRTKATKDMQAIASFAKTLKDSGLSDPIEIDRLMDDKLSEDQKNYIAGLYL